MRSRLLSLRLVLLVALASAAGIFAFGIGQETAVGALKGRAIARESGAPVKADVFLTSLDKVDGETLYYHVKSAKDGSFELTHVRVGAYTLAIQSRAHSMKATRVSIAEGATETIEAELQPDDPSLDLYIHQHVFTPDETAQITCDGFLDSDTLRVLVYKVDLNAFLLRAGGSLERVLGYESWQSSEVQSGLDLAANKSLTLAQSLSVRITERDVEGVFTRRVTLPVLAPGLYVTAVKAGGLQRVGWVMVSSLGMIVKSAGNQTLVYAVDLKSGAPVASAAVSVYVGEGVVAQGKTDANGLLNLTIPPNKGHSEQTIIARNGDSFAFLSATLSSSPSSDRAVYTYTERPVYRPGQTVFYKGIIRDRAGDGYKTPGPAHVVVEVRDPSDTLIYRGTKTTNAFGSYSGSLHLNSEAPSGPYSIQTSLAGETIEGESTGFSVASYRKPEFSVKATFDQPRCIRGDQVKAKVAVNYYFGAPVANANVSYVIERSPYYLFNDEDSYGGEGEGYSDYGGYGETVSVGEVRTDANGEAVIEFPATWPQPKDGEGSDQDQQFTISLTATDKADSMATGEGSIVATRGEFGVEVNSDSYVVTPGSDVGVSIKAMDYEKRPVRNKPVTVTLSRETWTDKGEVETETLETRDVTTDNLGRASVRLPAKKAGSLRVTALARDSRGNNIVSSSYVYCCSEAYGECDFGPVGDVQVVLDKKAYSPGDTAKVLILTKRPGGTALVTLEGSRVYDVRTVKLSGASAIVTFPIRADYKPNFYAAVSYMRDKKVSSNLDSARVSIKSQELRVRIEPSKRKYRPGNRADYTLKVTDSKGRPVSAELSMGVVDEAIYAIQPESTTPILDYFYAHRPNRVQTYDSIPQIYLSDPDKAGPPLKDAPVKVRVRKRFLDTACWNPSIVTDANGEARVSFSLPDNLTTWRTTVRGITTGTMCGQALNTVISQQPMLVRLEMPRFLVQHDQTVLSAIVHNYTGKDQSVKVTLKARGLWIDDDVERSVFVRDGGSERVDWDVSAPRPGTFAVEARAVGESAGDAVQLDLPVKPYGEQTVTATNAVVTNPGETNVTVYVRRDSIPEATRLKIRLAPSLAASMLGSLDYLAQYPYGCTEQTVSSFLPDVILFRSMKSLGVGNAKLQAKLPDMVQKGLSRLYRFELSEGGWSWCEYGKADPWMTAYVCYALIQAKQAGFAVNKEVMDRGLTVLENSVSAGKLDLYSKAFGCYVLELGGRDSTPIMESLVERQKLDSEALAVLALGYQKAGKLARADTMLTRLFAQSISDGYGIHWKGGHGWDGGDVEPSALALQAVLKINPKDSRVFDIVRWLMKTRRDDYWYSTRGTAMSLYAMSDFLKITKELSPNYTAAVLVNGRQVSVKGFDKGTIFGPQFEVTIPGKDLHKGRNEIRLVKDGPGNLYYSTNLTQYVEKKTMPPSMSGAGLTVTRAYYKPSPAYFESSRERDLGSPVDLCSVGDVILVRLTVQSSATFTHMMLEDNIPAGCEIVDRGDVSYDEWYHWWVGQDIRDDRISFYLDEVSVGKHTVEYQMRAGFTGTYAAMPAQVFSMYDPAVRATTGETGFRIR